MGKLVVLEAAEYCACVRVEKRGPGMDSSHREQAHEAVVQKPCLLWGPEGLSPVLGSRVPGMQVHTRRHPVCGGDEEAARPGAGCLARHPEQHVAG